MFSLCQSSIIYSMLVMETLELRKCIWDIESLNINIHHLADRILRESAIPLNRQMALMVKHLSTLLSDCWDTF